MFQSKLEEARALLTNHFTTVHSHGETPTPKTESTAKIPTDAFFTALFAAGGTDDEALKQCTWEDLESFGAPKLLAKRIATIFRKGEATSTPEDKVKILKPSRVAVMSVSELIEHYDPRDHTNPVGQRINTMCGGKRCIVFNTDGSINTKASVDLLNELRDNYPERETFLVNGVPVKTWKVGERPGQLVDENPLYAGRLLRPNGDCDQTNRSWTGIPHSIRVIIYLATKTGEVRINSVNEAHDIIDIAVSMDESRIRARFPKASLKYDELNAEGKLPTLKLPLIKNGSNSNNDPFGGQHKTY
jgi:hypothetical protein